MSSRRCRSLIRGERVGTCKLLRPKLLDPAVAAIVPVEFAYKTAIGAGCRGLSCGFHVAGGLDDHSFKLWEERDDVLAH